MIRYCETTFDDYLIANKKCDLHPEIAITAPITTNIIFYGPPGVGKYTQMLKSIFKTQQHPKDKKLSIVFNKQEYLFKMSTMHFEIDMSLLGCNSKLLWHEIFSQIIEIITTRVVPSKHLYYIVCKNFHVIHNELLDIFYSYMQQSKAIKYILLTEHVSFIPEAILDACRIIHVKRPSKTAYQSIMYNATYGKGSIQPLNIKYLKTGAEFSNTAICNAIATNLINNPGADFNKLRNHIYNILTYHLDIAECIWHIIYTLYGSNCGTIPNVILCELYGFFKQYNNNYRPIYHIERFLLLLIVEGYPTPIRP